MGAGEGSEPMNERRAAFFFLAPALAVILIFFLIPVLASLLLSITDFDIYALADIHNIRFIAFRNYQLLLSHPLFWKALGNTLYFTAVGGPLTMIVALASALLVNAKVARWKSLFRTVYFAPVVTTIVAVAVVWRYLYHPRVGLLNRLLGIFGIGADRLARRSEVGDAGHHPARGLEELRLHDDHLRRRRCRAIPEELYEAARIDGARALQQFRHVTLPMLAPTFVFVGIITAIGYLQLFPEPYVMTPTAVRSTARCRS